MRWHGTESIKNNENKRWRMESDLAKRYGKCLESLFNSDPPLINLSLMWQGQKNVLKGIHAYNLTSTLLFPPETLIIQLSEKDTEKETQGNIIKYSFLSVTCAQGSIWSYAIYRSFPVKKLLSPVCTTGSLVILRVCLRAREGRAKVHERGMSGWVALLAEMGDLYV